MSTKPDKPTGRSQLLKPPAVKSLALSARPEIPVYQPIKASSPEFAEILKTFQADFFVVVAYSEIIKANLLEMPRLGCIQRHASLLPKYRGAAPIARCLMQGEKESGITIIKMAKELDAGDMLARKELSISEEMTAGELSLALCELGKNTLWEVIQHYETIHPVVQDHSKATFAPKVNSEDAEINWAKSSTEIHNLIRAVTPKPGAWCPIFLQGENRRLIIKKTCIENKEGSFAKPGTFLNQEGLVIACAEGSLRILELQLEGKKSLSAMEFERGVPKKKLIFIVRAN